MPSFRVQCAGGSDAPIIDAPTRAAAIREATRRGLTPMAVESLDAFAASMSVAGAAEATEEARSRGYSLGGGRFSGTQRAAVMRELSTGLDAGLPLVQALRLIARQRRSKAQRAVMERIIDKVEHGRGLAEALESAPELANDLSVSMVRAGEASGRLGEVLGHLADLLEGDVRLRRALVGATTYPGLLLVLSLASIILVATVIAPKILAEAAGAIDKLPWPTLVVQAFANFVLGWWWLLLSLLVVGVAGFVAMRRTPEGRLSMDKALLSIPLIGLLARDVAVSRFTRTLGTLTSSGINLLQALRITRATLGNKALEAVIEDVVTQVSQGKTLAAPMEESGYFPPMLVQIVAMGERSGRLEELLGHAARAMEERTEATLKMVTTLLPPLLVVAMAGVVGFIVLAILLPMLELQDAVGGAMG
ncbi:MAG: type II secretion system F family protein [Phycisphaeraceae bacterium]|nr:type II secretion system F family protein [Phycisphaeraceae bacterium]